MEFENKVQSREIGQMLYESGYSLGTAESCTGGKIAEALVATPGASTYFKGSIVSYVDEIKERLLGVSAEILAEKTAVCEEVAIQMVKGACETLHVDFAISATGYAGPTGGSKEAPVGTIWLACGAKDDVVSLKLEENYGRDRNTEVATSKALELFINYLSIRLKTPLPSEK